MQIFTRKEFNDALIRHRQLKNAIGPTVEFHPVIHDYCKKSLMDEMSELWYAMKNYMDSEEQKP